MGACNTLLAYGDNAVVFTAHTVLTFADSVARLAIQPWHYLKVMLPGTVAEGIERGPRMREIGSALIIQIKTIT